MVNYHPLSSMERLKERGGFRPLLNIFGKKAYIP
jgi:hypothetical protein